jgi:HD-GYP domain-containing protein (c-di-GMP phosphodiesterase class II)
LGHSYEIATQIGDHAGLAATWVSLSALASGAGQFEDSIRYATLAIEHVERACDKNPPNSIGAYFNRGNARFRLGRLEEASSDLARVSALCSGRSGVWFLAAQVASLCALAEVWLAIGEVTLATTLLDNAKALCAEDRGVPTAALNTDRVRGQLLVARGEHTAGLKLLEAVLEDAARSCGDAANDGEVMDALYALERTHRSISQPELANRYLTRIAVQLRANAERALLAAADMPSFPSARDVKSALRDLDTFIAGRQRMASAATSAALSAAAASLQHMVALTASACAIEEPSGEHGIRVAALCREVSRAMKLDEETERVAEYAGLVHDAGKSGVPTGVLTKADALTDHEERLLGDHSDYGAQMVERSAIPGRARVAEALRLHHHPYDGVGATRPLRGEAIPIEARILAVCDRFDALVTGRPRRPALSIADALRETFRMVGRDFDGQVVDVLIDVVRRLKREQADLLSLLAQDAEKYDYTSTRRKLRRAAEGTDKQEGS